MGARKSLWLCSARVQAVRLILAVMLVAPLVLMLGGTRVQAATPTACRVTNQGSGKAYPRLQTAVDAAAEGHRLTVRGGGGTLTLSDASTIRGNEASFGGGVYMSGGSGDDAGTLTMTGSSRIAGNTASRSGGGVSSDPLRSTLVGVVCGPDGNVRRNGPGDCAVIPDTRATDQ